MEVLHSKIFFFQSVIAAALFPMVFGSCGGDTRIAIWRLSLLLCSYFYTAICVLNPSIRKAGLFFFLTYPTIIAFVMDAVLSHAIGAVIIYLNSVLIAGLFGDVLAKLSPSAAAAAKNPDSAQEAHKEVAGDLGAIFSLSAVVFAVAMCLVAIFVRNTEITLAFIVVVSTILCLYLPLAIICALKPFQPAGGGDTVVVLGVEVERVTENVLACWYLLSFMLFILSFVLVSEVGAVVLLWICVLGLAVLLGYCLRAPTCFIPAHHEAQGEDGCTASLKKKQTDAGSPEEHTDGRSKEL